jgi:hypothetical protein
MRRFVVAVSSWSCVVFASAIAVPSSAAVKGPASEVKETRVQTLIKKENVFSSDVSRLQLTLHIDGDGHQGRHQVGQGEAHRGGR